MSRYSERVFINCPFDKKYRPMFDALVFVVHDCGFIARSALQIDDAGVNRLAKILKLIGECKYGIHDLSRTELNTSGLPRFNMPLELGLFLGCREFGDARQPTKNAMVMDSDQYRYRNFISDIAGHDIVAHGNKLGQAIASVRNWLNATREGKSMPGGKAIHKRFLRFQHDLPILCKRVSLTVAELTFTDYSNFVAEWLREIESRSR